MLNCVYYLQLLLFFCYLPSGVFRRKATVRWPPLSPDHENFLRRLYMKRCVFCRFPARIAKLNNVWWSFYNMRLKSPCEIASDMMLWFSAFPNFRKNGRICSFHWTFRSKVFQLQGSFAPLTPRPGALPLDPAGGSVPRPPLAMPPSLPNPKYATALTGCTVTFDLQTVYQDFHVVDHPVAYACES